MMIPLEEERLYSFRASMLSSVEQQVFKILESTLPKKRLDRLLNGENAAFFNHLLTFKIYMSLTNPLQVL